MPAPYVLRHLSVRNDKFYDGGFNPRQLYSTSQILSLVPDLELDTLTIYDCGANVWMKSNQTYAEVCRLVKSNGFKEAVPRTSRSAWIYPNFKWKPKGLNSQPQKWGQIIKHRDGEDFG